MGVLQGNINVKGKEIFYREAGDQIAIPKGVVLLLHGMRFSSLNWQEISTLKKLEEWNFRAIAIDLPGYGESKNMQNPTQTAQFLKDVCETFNIKKVILVSPSMSGMYSIPFIHEFPYLVQAYIPIMPVSTEKYTIQQYKALKIPTFIVYGENDQMPFAQIAIKLLKSIPNSKDLKMENAKHACYLDQTDQWHEILENLLNEL